ncbi:MAG: hypothetical protein Q8N16_00570 [bacterium]|nr:hypothetical protein [bacterium]
MIKKGDWGIAWLVTKVIQGLDALVLPGDPIPAEIVFTVPAKDDYGKRSYVRYTSGEESGERYVVFVVGIAAYLEKQTQGKDTKKHLALIKGLGADDFATLPVFTMEELIVAIASHEIRHRLQDQKPALRMFSPTNVSSWSPELRPLGEAFKTAFAKGFLGGDVQSEFDAKIVEYLAGLAARLGKNPEEIAAVIKIEP